MPKNLWDQVFPESIQNFQNLSLWNSTKNLDWFLSSVFFERRWATLFKYGKSPLNIWFYLIPSKSCYFLFIFSYNTYTSLKSCYQYGKKEAWTTLLFTEKYKTFLSFEMSRVSLNTDLPVSKVGKILWKERTHLKEVSRRKKRSSSGKFCSKSHILAEIFVIQHDDAFKKQSLELIWKTPVSLVGQKIVNSANGNKVQK